MADSKPSMLPGQAGRASAALASNSPTMLPPALMVAPVDPVPSRLAAAAQVCQAPAAPSNVPSSLTRLPSNSRTTVVNGSLDQ